jgi:hypothetical protein
VSDPGRDLGHIGSKNRLKMRQSRVSSSQEALIRQSAPASLQNCASSPRLANLPSQQRHIFPDLSKAVEKTKKIRQPDL